MYRQWNDAKEDVLLGLPRLVWMLYLHRLRRYSDDVTETAGFARGIGHRSLQEMCR